MRQKFNQLRDSGEHRLSRLSFVFSFTLSFFALVLTSTALGLGQSHHDSDITVSLEAKSSTGSSNARVKNEPVISISGYAKTEQSPLIKVWLKTVNPNTAPPLAGKSVRTAGGWEFRPRFPLRAGKAYRIRIRTGDGGLRDFYLSTPAVDRTPAKVTKVFPSSQTIPANTLKFYLHFATPMEKGNVYQYVRLRKSDGTKIELPFLEIEQEFWSRDSLRLTLLLDPGRIKRGLKPREQMGPIFEAGKNYELVVSGDWPDGNGVKLGDDFIKTYRATEEDYQQPQPEDWRFKLPKVDSSDPFVVSFDEALDHSMLQHAIEVRHSNGSAMEGRYTAATDSKSLTFTPKLPWSAGSYQLAIATNLEDQAGNSVGRQFDVDVFEKTEPTNRDEVVVRLFKIKKN